MKSLFSYLNRARLTGTLPVPKSASVSKPITAPINPYYPHLTSFTATSQLTSPAFPKSPLLPFYSTHKGSHQSEEPFADAEKKNQPGGKLFIGAGLAGLSLLLYQLTQSEPQLAAPLEQLEREIGDVLQEQHAYLSHLPTECSPLTLQTKLYLFNNPSEEEKQVCEQLAAELERRLEAHQQRQQRFITLIQSHSTIALPNTLDAIGPIIESNLSHSKIKSIYLHLQQLECQLRPHWPN